MLNQLSILVNYTSNYFEITFFQKISRKYNYINLIINSISHRIKIIDTKC